MNSIIMKASYRRIIKDEQSDYRKQIKLPAPKAEKRAVIKNRF